MKIAIGLPIGGPMDPRCVRSLMALSSTLTREKISFATICHFNSPDLAGVHNRIFHDFLALGEAEVLVNIDSDIVFDPKDFLRLLRHEHAIVAGNYAKKSIGAGMAATPRAGGAVIGDLVEAENVGTGFVRFSREAIARLAEASPVFQCDQTGQLTRAIMQVGPWGGRWILNDEWLVRRWQSFGEVVWIDRGIHLGHVGSHEYREV